MILFKWLGILLLSGIPIAWGWKKGRQFYLYKQEVAAFLTWVRTCRQSIAFQQLPICDISDHLSQIDYPIINQLCSLLKCVPPSDAWRNVSLQIQYHPLVSVMNIFFASLGTSDCDSQLNICDLTIHQLDQIQITLEKETPDKVKLYRTIGTLTGVFVAIILI